MPHMHGHIDVRSTGTDMHGSATYIVNGQSFFLGYATSEQNNCLIDTLRQVLHDQANLPCFANMREIRARLHRMFPTGPAGVRISPPIFWMLIYTRQTLCVYLPNTI